MAAVEKSKSDSGLLSHHTPLSLTLQPHTPLHTVNLSSRCSATLPLPAFPLLALNRLPCFFTDVLFFSRLVLILRPPTLKV